jgi:hypothetical protein
VPCVQDMAAVAAVRRSLAVHPVNRRVALVVSASEEEALQEAAYGADSVRIAWAPACATTARYALCPGRVLAP